jgi:predicted phage baseplate assembly protein
LQTASAVLLGNVVMASHGETVSNEPLGSGNASQKFQSFQLQKAPLTYVPDTSPTGLASSLQVSINQERWSEVPELYGQSGTARIYSAAMTDEGKTAVQFGDGTMGALLPTGQANVLATYRVGAGLAGRVGANTLTTLLNRPTNLSSATNPLPAEGGADPESMATARQNAPRTVRTFGRAVSLRDFEDLVTASGEVAKAQAGWVWDGFAPAVHLTVAGQAGGTFSEAGLARLGTALNAARDTNHRLLMDNYVRVPIRIQATVLPDPARSKEAVLAAALQALLQYLAFDQLTLGQSIHLSGIYAVLQGVVGVIAADVIVLSFKKPVDMTPAQFQAYLATRGVTFLPSGAPAPVQGHLRICAARTDAARPGSILPAELAWVATPAQDIVVTAQGG